MEDSGFDTPDETDSKAYTNREANESGNSNHNALTSNGDVFSDEVAIRPIRKSSSDLQKKIERQREASRRASAEQAGNKRGLLTRNRLPVPSKRDLKDSGDSQPLVMIDSESEDEFAVPRLSRQAQKEIAQQLIRDGYNLDLAPDDEDLDLIPPRPVHERCICCNTQLNCCIQ
ncbi:hypothetical protein CAPTEDRAFT_228648 [Capitella teleta]|uniref:Protein FAM219A n=1 Tax=Capitella teleta TaxID=283909 RepID=R7TV94_CAPTE|nr:hypothetical protein CAPTEDRAFT_228648 [Capitella teleta]|eukprot:ELT94935.1 hypothetical protein CAPTEDRAFT_228648 [Capitella teleta]